MVPAAKTLTNLPWDAAAVEAFAPVVDGNPWGPLESAPELLRGSYLFEYRDGRQRALVAAVPVQRSAGMRVEIVAMRSLGDRLQARPFLAALDGMALGMGATVMAATSGVPHVINSLQRHGWHQSGALLTRTIGAHDGRPQ